MSIMLRSRLMAEAWWRSVNRSLWVYHTLPLEAVEFWSLFKSSIVSNNGFVQSAFFPLSFRWFGLYLLWWWWDITGWVLIIRLLLRIGLVSLRSPGLEAYTLLELMMRSGLKTGNRFLLMMDEVSYILYGICSTIWLFLLIRGKNDTRSRSCTKSLPFCVRRLGHNFNRSVPVSMRVIYCESFP